LPLFFNVVSSTGKHFVESGSVPESFVGQFKRHAQGMKKAPCFQSA
jgi:hypothetical protein